MAYILNQSNVLFVTLELIGMVIECKTSVIADVFWYLTFKNDLKNRKCTHRNKFQRNILWGGVSFQDLHHL